MLTNYIDNLQSTIQWAQYQDDLDVLCLARDRMNQLLSFVDTLPVNDQQQAYQHIDEMVPMEWPMWMEACRYEDIVQAEVTVVTLH